MQGVVQPRRRPEKDRLRPVRHRPHAMGTHGRPTEENASASRCRGRIVVHNGIIENYLERSTTRRKGIRSSRKRTRNRRAPRRAEWQDDGLSGGRRALKQLRDPLSRSCAISADEPDHRDGQNGPPVVVGLGEDCKLSRPTFRIYHILRASFSRSRASIAACVLSDFEGNG